MTTLTNAQVSFLLSNIVGNNTYSVVDQPSNRYNFLGVNPEYFTQEDIDSLVKSNIKVFSVNDKEVDDVIIVCEDNDVKIAEYSHVLELKADNTSTYLLLWGDITYDIHFNDENNSNNEGYSKPFLHCKNYISLNNGSDCDYFKSYKNGTVSIVCNETSETVYEEEIETPVKVTVKGYEHAKVYESASNYIVDLRTGLGKGFYPKDSFSIEDAINDALADHSC